MDTAADAKTAATASSAKPNATPTRERKAEAGGPRPKASPALPPDLATPPPRQAPLPPACPAEAGGIGVPNVIGKAASNADGNAAGNAIGNATGRAAGKAAGTDTIAAASAGASHLPIDEAEPPDTTAVGFGAADASSAADATSAAAGLGLAIAGGGEGGGQWYSKAIYPPSMLAEPPADAHMLVVGITFLGRRKLVRHLSSCRAGEIVDLQLSGGTSQQAMGRPLAVLGRDGVQIGREIPLFALKPERQAVGGVGGAGLVDGELPIELWLEVDGWAE